MNSNNVFNSASLFHCSDPNKSLLKREESQSSFSPCGLLPPLSDGTLKTRRKQEGPSFTLYLRVNLIHNVFPMFVTK